MPRRNRDMVQVVAHIPSKAVAVVDEIARKEDRFRAEIIRRVVVEYAEQQTIQETH